MKEARKTIQIRESTFKEFNERKEAGNYGNASELLQELLNEEMRKTIVIEKGTSFHNIEKRLEKGR
ncbi:MAG: hypothetical protein NWE98_10150 [Candidatus Bathyarchaeota archaeon]|nr:hypothetical protein [Candidatus Bathyarchaeota archaeon]